MFPEDNHPLLQNVLQLLRDQSVDDRIQAMILDLVNQALRAQQVVLSNPEKEHFVQFVQKAVLTEMLEALE